MPKESAAASSPESERKCFLCRGPHLARDRPDRNKHNGASKKGLAKGKTSAGNGTGSGAVSMALACGQNQE